MIKKPNHSIIAIGIACSSLLINSCGSKDLNRNQAFISAPFKNAKIDFASEEVDAPLGRTIKFANGSSIVIPANAFVDANNNPINGKVTIKYREFHDAADIILSGIPMGYDSAGVNGNFQTAGMFEINGFQNNEKIYIAKDKKVQVNLASFASGNKYNFYALDTTAKKWQYNSHPAPSVNEEKLAKIKSKVGKEVTKPVSPQEFDPNKFVFDFEVNTKLYPELAGFQNIIWQYNGNDAATDPENNKWIFDERWTNVKLEMKDEANSEFWIILTNSGKQFKSVVKPVFAGKKLEKAKDNFKKRQKEYEEYSKNRNLEAQRLQNEADFIRTMQLSSFGIYNYDYNYHNPEVIALNAKFEFDEKFDQNNLRVFMITGDGRVVIKYDRGSFDKFNYIPSERNKMIAVLPGDKVAVFNDSDFQNLGFARGSAPEEYTFKLKTIDKKITSAADLRSVISL